MGFLLLEALSQLGVQLDIKEVGSSLRASSLFCALQQKVIINEEKNDSKIPACNFISTCLLFFVIIIL